MFDPILQEVINIGMDENTPFIDNATATSKDLLNNVLNSGNNAHRMLSFKKMFRGQ